MVSSIRRISKTSLIEFPDSGICHDTSAIDSASYVDDGALTSTNQYHNTIPIESSVLRRDTIPSRLVSSSMVSRDVAPPLPNRTAIFPRYLAGPGTIAFKTMPATSLVSRRSNQVTLEHHHYFPRTSRNVNTYLSYRLVSRNVPCQGNAASRVGNDPTGRLLSPICQRQSLGNPLVQVMPSCLVQIGGTPIDYRLQSPDPVAYPQEANSANNRDCILRRDAYDDAKR